MQAVGQKWRGRFCLAVLHLKLCLCHVVPGTSGKRSAKKGQGMRVNYGQTVHGEEEIAAVVDVLRTSTQMGPKVEAFEGQVADLFAKTHGIMVNSGSSALYLACEVLGFEKGSEFITPVLTFNTTVAPFMRAGMIPFFVDVEEGTYNIDVERMADAVTDKTVALIVPSLVGNLPDWDAIQSLAKDKGLLVLEDSSDTLGATLGGASTGTRSDISVTSFYGSHIINCAGNGGLVAFNDPEMAERARLLRSWGRTSSVFGKDESETTELRFDIKLDGIEYDRKFVFAEMGFNFEPSEMGAAFGLVQLKKLQGNLDARRSNFAQHLAFFKNHEDYFILPRELPDVRTGWLAFAVTIRDSAPFTRRQFQTYLENADIQTRPVFTGNILRQPAYAEAQYKSFDEGYPHADQVMRGGVLLACHHGLDQPQIDFMHSTIEAFLDSI